MIKRMSFSEERMSLFRQSDAAQVAGNDAQTQPPFHPVQPVISAFAPAEVAPETRDSSLDACTLAIAAPKTSCALQGLPFL
jgi:hypothetical protein